MGPIRGKVGMRKMESLGREMSRRTHLEDLLAVGDGEEDVHRRPVVVQVDDHDGLLRQAAVRFYEEVPEFHRAKDE